MNDADTVLLTQIDWWNNGWSFGFFRPDSQAVMFNTLARELGTDGLEDWQRAELNSGWNEGRIDRQLYEEDMARKSPCCPHCGQPLTAGGMAEHACVEDQIFPL